MRLVLAILALGLLLAGCAATPGGQLTFESPEPGRRPPVFSGQESVATNSVRLETIGVAVSGRASLLLTVHNGSAAPFEISPASVRAGVLGGPTLRVWTREQLVDALESHRVLAGGIYTFVDSMSKQTAYENLERDAKRGPDGKSGLDRYEIERFLDERAAARERAGEYRRSLDEFTDSQVEHVNSWILRPTTVPPGKYVLGGLKVSMPPAEPQPVPIRIVVDVGGEAHVFDLRFVRLEP